MYTSGTTGEPKGVLITNENIVTLVTGINHLLRCQDEELSEKDVYISFLPLAHIFDRVLEEYFISKSASIGFYRGDAKLLVEDMAELKMTVFCGVPRVFDRIYSGLNQKISAGGFLSRKVFELAYKYKLNNMRKGWKHEKAAPIADKLPAIPNVISMIGTVGPPIPHVEARLESVPDMGYDALSQVPRGEIPILLEAFKYFKK